MRVTTAFKRLLRLGGVNVTAVEWTATAVIVTVTLRRRRLVCPHCGFTTAVCHDLRPGMSRWRHLDLGVWRVEIAARLRRLACPTHGVIVEGVPFARPGAHLTRDFDHLLAWLATRTDKSAVARLCRVSWRTVGRACERVVATDLDPGRLNGLFRIGVDEIWRAYEMKEQFRAIFAGDLEPTDAIELLDRWIARTCRSRLAPFVKAAKTMRDRRGIIVNAIEQGLSNGRVEGLNTKVRLLVRRAYGFHSAEAALALVMLACGPIDLKLPHEHAPQSLAA